jgi:hypothetical protein
MGIQVIQNSSGGSAGLQIKNGAAVTSNLQVITDFANTDTGAQISTAGLLYNTITFNYATVSGGLSINCQVGDIISTTLSNSTPTAITLINPRKGSIILQLKQPSSGAAATVTWATTIVWAGGSAPTLTTTNNYVDLITLVYDGTTWRGTATLNFAS